MITLSNTALEKDFCLEGDPRVAGLVQRLTDYYAQPKDYTVFEETSYHWERWQPVLAAIRARIERNGRCRVLEIGAGRTGFREALADLRDKVEWTVQDITGYNREHLTAAADHVHIGPVHDVAGRYDVIFCCFVLEHIPDPAASLVKIFNLLEPGGKFYLFCPKYEFPGYLSHSLDHYPPARKRRIHLAVLRLRLLSRLRREPVFLIHLDPSVLHMDYSTDRDAIHFVSEHSIRLLAKKYGACKRVPLPAGSLYQRFAQRFMQVSLEFTRA